ncbi:putative membrane protein [Caballeronia udeis]|uniref:Membrane protein n=1 Tax=Caballeronia udeis TaxID=1232866 RepID=A0ABW8MJG7_9BURK
MTDESLQPQQSENNDVDAKALPLPVGSASKTEDGKFEVAEEEKRLTEKVRRIMMSESFSGPTPHPKHVQQYDQILPGAAKIIFDQFQANAEHQRRMEERQMVIQERVVELQGRDNAADSSKDQRAQYLAAGLVVFGIAAALIFGYMKQPWVSVVIIGTLLVAVITGYLRGKTKDDAQSNADNEDENDAEK